MDRERADFERALASLQQPSVARCVPVQFPLGSEHAFSGVVDLVRGKAYLYDRDGTGKAKEVGLPTDRREAAAWRAKLVEAVAETDDALMEKFFESGELSRRGPGSRAAPGDRASASSSRSCFRLGRPRDRHRERCSTSWSTSRPRRSTAPRSRPPNVGGAADRAGAPTRPAPAAALVFKTLSDPFTGKISILRVVSGTLSGDCALWNMRAEEVEKLGHVADRAGQTGGQRRRS